MDHITMALLFAGAFILIVFIILALKAFQRHRREKAAAFRYYFGPEYDRDLLEQSALSETEEWRADYRPSFTPFRLRHPEFRERR
jgi:hypothetical protein